MNSVTEIKLRIGKCEFQHHFIRLNKRRIESLLQHLVAGPRFFLRMCELRGTKLFKPTHAIVNVDAQLGGNSIDATLLLIGTRYSGG